MTFRGSSAATGLRTLAESATPSAHTGDLLETILATISIPANTIGPNGQIVIEAMFTLTNNADAKNPKIRFGAAGSGLAGIAIVTSGGANAASIRGIFTIANRGAQNSQAIGATNFNNVYGVPSTALGVSAIDTSQPTEINITGQLAVAGDTIQLEFYRVEVSP